MLSIVIPTLDAGATLAGTLAALAQTALETEIVVADGGSTDATREIARSFSCKVIPAPRGRGPQLQAGAEAAEGAWLLFLHADTVPGPEWSAAVAKFIADPANRSGAAVFRYVLDDPSAAARRIERLVAWRCRLLALPYGDQGLLIGRGLFDRIGGFRPMTLYEDIDIIRRIGRRRLGLLEAPAVTSAERYRRGGFVLRPLRNLTCLSLYFLGMPPAMIGRLYR